MLKVTEDIQVQNALIDEAQEESSKKKHLETAALKVTVQIYVAHSLITLPHHSCVDSHYRFGI